MPVGTIISYLGNNAPDGYLFCDGTEYNIVDYPALANHFETEFGTKNYFGGDGETTFKVPDLQGEFLRCTGTNSHSDCGNGDAVGVHQDEGVPNISGWLIDIPTQGQGGVFTVSATTSYKVGLGSGSSTFKNINFNASSSNAKYGKSSNITPTNTSVWYCIKF